MLADQHRLKRHLGIAKQHCCADFGWHSILIVGNDRMNSELEELLRKSRIAVNAMTPEQKAEMLRKQGEGWAKSEAQWAKDFREGKCERD
jgi:hypothetical protein